jgi:hypothetical protein
MWDVIGGGASCRELRFVNTRRYGSGQKRIERDAFVPPFGIWREVLQGLLQRRLLPPACDKRRCEICRPGKHKAGCHGPPARGSMRPPSRLVTACVRRHARKRDGGEHGP